jgi:hypothetical protein
MWNKIVVIYGILKSLLVLNKVTLEEKFQFTTSHPHDIADDDDVDVVDEKKIL